MVSTFLRSLLVLALVVSNAGCASISHLESKKAENYELAPSSLLTLAYLTMNGYPEGFADRLKDRFAACGITEQFQTVPVLLNDVGASREAFKPIISKRLSESGAKTVLEVVPAVESYMTRYGAKVSETSTTYMVALKNLGGDIHWSAKLNVSPPSIMSYEFYTAAPLGQRFAETLIDQMVSDGVLTHCPVKQGQ